MKIQATVVFEKNWEAIHATDEQGNRLYKYIINTGASRSSKTRSLIDCYDIYARQNKTKRLTVWRNTKKECKDTVLKDMLKAHKKTGRYEQQYTFHTTDSIFNYTNDSTVEIHGTDEVEKVHGLTQDAAWLNEPYKISKDIFDQIDQRTSDFIFIDWNPRQSHWIEEVAKSSRAIVIHSTYKDNPFCPLQQKKKIESYQPIAYCNLVTSNTLTESEARSYDIAENKNKYPKKHINELRRCQENEDTSTANTFNWQVYGLGLKAERPNRIYSWKEIPYQEYLRLTVPRYYYVDWGDVDPFAIGEFKYYDGQLYVHELNYASQNELKSKLSLTELAQINKNHEAGFLVWFFEKLGIDKNGIIICDNNRPSRVLALREAGWHNAIAPAKPEIIDRVGMLQNIPVNYTNTSVNIAFEQEVYSRETDRRTGEVLEKPEDKNNHHMDGIGYGANFLRTEGIIKTF